MPCVAQRLPTEPEGIESASDSGESKDKKVCTSQESQPRRQRVRLNTSLHSPIRAIPGRLDGDVKVVDGEDLDASSNRNLPPSGPAAENTSHSRARSDLSSMRFEADRVSESIRREYNRKLGKIGPCKRINTQSMRATVGSDHPFASCEVMMPLWPTGKDERC